MGWARSGPEICRGHFSSRYTGIRLRADALVASAVQESAGGVKQQPLPTPKSYDGGLWNLSLRLNIGK